MEKRRPRVLSSELGLIRKLNFLFRELTLLYDRDLKVRTQYFSEKFGIFFFNDLLILLKRSFRGIFSCLEIMYRLICFFVHVSNC